MRKLKAIHIDKFLQSMNLGRKIKRKFIFTRLWKIFCHQGTMPLVGSIVDIILN